MFWEYLFQCVSVSFNRANPLFLWGPVRSCEDIALRYDIDNGIESDAALIENLTYVQNHKLNCGHSRYRFTRISSTLIKITLVGLPSGDVRYPEHTCSLQSIVLLLHHSSWSRTVNQCFVIDLTNIFHFSGTSEGRLSLIHLLILRLLCRRCWPWVYIVRKHAYTLETPGKRFGNNIAQTLSLGSKYHQSDGPTLAALNVGDSTGMVLMCQRAGVQGDCAISSQHTA